MLCLVALCAAFAVTIRHMLLCDSGEVPICRYCAGNSGLHIPALYIKRPLLYIMLCLVVPSAVSAAMRCTWWGGVVLVAAIMPVIMACTYRRYI